MRPASSVASGLLFATGLPSTAMPSRRDRHQVAGQRGNRLDQRLVTPGAAAGRDVAAARRLADVGTVRRADRDDFATFDRFSRLHLPQAAWHRGGGIDAHSARAGCGECSHRQCAGQQHHDGQRPPTHSVAYDDPALFMRPPETASPHAMSNPSPAGRSSRALKTPGRGSRGSACRRSDARRPGRQPSRRSPRSGRPHSSAASSGP